MKKVLLITAICLVAALLYWVFLKYTRSTAFVKKDIDALNLTYRYSNEEFRNVCDNMSRFSYVSGLTGVFIPIPIPYGITYYYKSRCYQQLAIQTLDANLCTRVVERKSLFYDGSGVSERECRKEVAMAQENDKKQQEEVDKYKFSIEGAAKIVDTETKVEKMSPNSWKVNVSTEGTLFGEYEIKIVRGDVDIKDQDTRGLLLKENVSIKTNMLLVMALKVFLKRWGLNLEEMGIEFGRDGD